MIPLKDDIPVSRLPILTVLLVGTNLAAFVWQLSTGLALSVQAAGAVPYEILTLRDIGVPDLVPPPLTILTSMFLHGGFIHIAGNMLFLWIFGNNVEDSLGRVRFLFFYLTCGIAAALAQIFVSGATENAMIPLVGASGAIAGVLAAYLALYPHGRVLTLVPIFVFIRLIYIPAYFFIGFWFVVQLLSAIYGGSDSGVAFVAHVGGFLCGFILVKLMGARPKYRRSARW